MWKNAGVFRSFVSLVLFTPWKINMEPKTHPIEKENHLPSFFNGLRCLWKEKLAIFGFSSNMKVFQPHRIHGTGILP